MFSECEQQLHMHALGLPFPSTQNAMQVEILYIDDYFVVVFFSRSPFNVRLQLLNLPLRVKVHPRPMQISDHPRRAWVWQLQLHLHLAPLCRHRPFQSPAAVPNWGPPTSMPLQTPQTTRLMFAASTATVVPILVSCINMAVTMLQVHTASMETSAAKQATRKKMKRVGQSPSAIQSMASRGMTCNIHTKTK